MQNIFFTGVMIALFLSISAGKKYPVHVFVPQADSTKSQLDAHKWNLVKIHYDTGTLTITGKNAFIRFDMEKEKAGGKGSCNSFGSTLAVNGRRISISDVFSTKMYCEGVQSIEDRFFNGLQKVTRYEITGRTLLLFAGENPVLEFERE